ncbi:MAG: dipeptide epimerase [Sphingobacteriales bacterium]|jgi:L-alanine-DL-glutamate epimerase-like enolase superfamily enzyme
MKLNHYSHELPFVYPFTISKGTKTHQPTLVVELAWRGLKGYGEAPAINYYEITVESMIKDLEAKRTVLEKFALTDPERYWHFLHHLFPRNPFLVCALDMAGWDLWGKMVGKPLYQLWQLDPSKAPLTDYTIGIDSTERMIAKIEENPWPVYKVKVGFDGDMEMLAELRRHTQVPLRVDVNAGWSLEQALEKIPVMESLGVELVEQPLAKDNWEGMAKLFQVSPIPLFADESCVAEQDVEKCKGHFHGINIKLTKCSGITPARRMIKQARSLGMQVMLGCMNESSIGTSAMIHLSPLLDHLDADGPMLLKTDLASGLQYDNGRVSFTHPAPGLSIAVSENLYVTD